MELVEGETLAERLQEQILSGVVIIAIALKLVFPEQEILLLAFELCASSRDLSRHPPLSPLISLAEGTHLQQMPDADPQLLQGRVRAEQQRREKGRPPGGDLLREREGQEQHAGTVLG